MISAERMVDLDRYPIADPGHPEGAGLAARCRRTYLETGLCALHGFIRPEALEVLAAEARGLSPKAHFCRDTHNAYLTEDDGTGGVRSRQEETHVGSVAYDLIPEGAALRRLYMWDPLRDFVGAVLGRTGLHRFADIMGACSINVYRDGGEHGWHFDESEFTVTLMLQPPERGGAFEYVPGIRGLPDEEEIVARVLDGRHDGVVELPFTAGTLLIFGGSRTIHRVTRVSGPRERLVPVLCYSEEEGASNSPEVRRLFWGRTGEEVRA